MSNIIDITEPWAGHSGLEVETWLKSMLASTLATLGSKVGYVELSGSSLVFYDEEGGNVISTISLSGDVYNIAIACNLDQVFYVLADETTKMMTITPSTTVSQFGSSDSQPFPEGYSYVVYVNTGSGYVPRINGQIPTGGSATFDIRPFLSTGDNYIRVSVTGDTSEQVRTAVFTGTLTTLTMSVNHTWQNVWEQGQSYTINGIRFAGNLVKRLHVAVDGTEVGYVDYTANQSYTTTPTSYTIPANKFPASENGTHEVSLWMTAQGVSTRVFRYNIMCIATGDTTPVITINAITPTAVNWTSDKLFSYAVWGANKATFDLSALLGAITYQITPTPVVADNLVEATQYDFNYAIEIDTGVNEVPTGTLTAEATAFLGSTEGESITITTALDNTYSYLATPGALFYMVASTRSNSELTRNLIVNEMGASEDGNFDASYLGTWTGFAWNADAWDADSSGYRALRVPAGCTLTVADFAPLSLIGDYSEGMTFEVMMKNEYPADYDDPILTLASGTDTKTGLIIYPTKIVVYGSNERSEVNQTVNISENRMTHLCVTFVKNYEGISGRNLVSIYVNGISNINFAFDAMSNFGSGSLVVGQQDTDVFIYRMRVYGTALDSRSVFNNFLNSVVDGVEFNRRQTMIKNNIYEGQFVDYEAVKAAGFNTMVVTLTDDNTYLPSIDHPAPSNGYPDCSMRFEYADDPTKNVTVSGVSIDGQGTTSKKYYRWNLRAKTGSSTTWEYGDGTSATGKKGKFINDDDYVKVDRITAKKNYASSMQGHKMGFTGLYNDLFKGVGLGSHMPDEDFRVAVYQFPFVGFRYYEANDSYEYIGQYTAGPDKGSKITFGYSDDYMNLMSIEGPNHSPRGTRFLHPWTDVEYSVEDESLFIGGIEAWDADYVNYETSSKGTAADWAAIRALYEAEWRPAYECVYNNSPHIASVAEVIAAVDDPSVQDLADILDPDNVDTIIGVTVPGMLVPIQCIAIYDTSYELYFYRETTHTIVSLASVDSNLEHNVKTALASYLNDYCTDPTAPTTAEIIAMRAARFKATAPNYWDIDQTLYHYAFCELYGVSDNFAKNSYPFKFVGYSDTLPSGANVNQKRWGWREDDMDTVMMTDNNGNNTKKYSVEPGDTIGANRDQIFQGYNSALWVLIHDNYYDEIRTMMLAVVNAASALATSYGVSGDGLHGSLFNLTSYYCWDHSAKYFAELLYEEDRRWDYIEPWLQNPSAVYNSVPPLTQALGDQYQAERLWMERRIAYIFSKYKIGAFNGATEGYHEIAFTLASMFKFYLTPAIDLYPTAATGSTTVQAPRTQAGSVAEITLTTTGDTTNYIKGGDWLASLGDLSGMTLSARGGGDIAFNLNCARLKRLKIGDEVAGNVNFNADTFAVSSPSLTEIDAQNTVTLRNLVNLISCPRLRKVLFAGSGATGLVLPVGAKVTEVSFPSEANSVFLSNLPFLENAGLTLPDSDAIYMLYVNDCPNLDPLGIATDALEAQGSTLAYATLGWDDTVTGDSDTADTILALSELSGKVTYENNTLTPVAGKPYVEGTVRISSGLYADDIAAFDLTDETTIEDDWKEGLSRLFDGGLYIQYNPDAIYIRFADPEVLRVLLANNIGDGTGVTMTQAAAVTNLGTIFLNNTVMTSFDELRYFGITTFPNNSFSGMTSLESVSWPASMDGRNPGQNFLVGCSALETLTLYGRVNGSSGSAYSFGRLPSLVRVNIPDIETWLGCSWYNYTSCPGGTSHSIHLYPIGSDEEFTTVNLPNSLTSIRNAAFLGCVGLTSVTIPSSVTDIGEHAFRYCTSLTSITIPNISTIKVSTFEGCSALVEATLSSSVTRINASAFSQCTSLATITLNSSIYFLRCFQGCSNLRRINVPSSDTWCRCTFSEYISPPGYDSSELHLYSNNVEITSITIPNDVTTIYFSQFRNFKGITSVTIPTSVTSIGQQAFLGCSGLAGTLTIPSSVTSIGSNAFQDCSGITGTLVVHSSVTSIGSDAFRGCTGITNLYWYRNVSSRNLLYNPNTSIGNGTGLLYVEGDFNAYPMDIYYQFRQIIIDGDLNMTNADNRYFNKSNYQEEVRILGDITYNASGTWNYIVSSTGLAFFEVIGDIGDMSSQNPLLYDCSNGAIMHLGKSGIACLPSKIIRTNAVAKLSKIYVGDGTNDDAVLAMYQADPDWQADTTMLGKLAKWSDYTGPYKTPPTIPTE